MQIGNYQLTTLETGTFALDGGAMFGSVPKVLWSRLNPADERNRIAMALRCLLIRGEGKNILVDTGVGYKFPEKERGIYKIDHSRSTLEKSLEGAGLTAEDITDVIITHLHFDHAGGATTRENGKLRPTFANARYHLQEANLKTASDPNDRERRSYLKENYLPLQEAGCLELKNGRQEIFPGIELFPVFGHTEGQHIVRIGAADGDALIFCGDLIPTSSHLAIPWVMGYDLHPLICMREKKAILEEAARNDWILFFEHDPGIAAARIRKTDKGFTIGEPLTP